jgi:hypothetical protein
MAKWIATPNAAKGTPAGVAKLQGDNFRFWFSWFE